MLADPPAASGLKRASLSMDKRYLALPITTGSDVTKLAVAMFAEQLLSHGNKASCILDCVSNDPDCSMAQACAAALFLTKCTREGQLQAQPHIAAARAGAHLVSERERYCIAAISYWGRGQDAKAVRVLRATVEAWPHDLLAAKLCQILEIGLGDVIGMCRTAAYAVAANQPSGFALGLHAFALEQAGERHGALSQAHRAIERNPGRDPWAHHAAAHALVALEQHEQARDFLRSHSREWERCSSFMFTHNWWHLALCEIELGDPHAALRLFDERVWAVRKGHCQDQINAISLLARLELRGLAVGSRWDELARWVAPRCEDRISRFFDLHFVYALARGERIAAAQSMIEDRHEGGVFQALAKGMLARACADYGAAALAFAPAMDQLASIGGSNVQRELFKALFTDSVKRACAIGSGYVAA